MNNPWLNISWKNTIADCDKECLVQVGKKEFYFGSKEYVDYINRNDAKIKQTGKGKPVDLTFDKCLPEPFYGDPNSQVYLLGMNPGEPDKEFIEKNDNQNDYVNNCIAMLKHDMTYLNKPGLLYDSMNQTIFYDPNKYNLILKDIFDNNRIKEFKEKKENFPIRPHVGDVWQWEMWKQLREKNKCNPRVFSIEYFPYHSTSGFAFPTYLPSYEYRNKHNQKAMDDHKLIIIMRNEEMWYDIKFKGQWSSLKDYPNKVFLRNKQRIWLTTGNFVWEIPEERILMPNWACQSVNEIIEKFK